MIIGRQNWHQVVFEIRVKFGQIPIFLPMHLQSLQANTEDIPLELIEKPTVQLL
jgi:hypothetical protein